jgi:Ca2+-binding RTX toxin-like protein
VSRGLLGRAMATVIGGGDNGVIYGSSLKDRLYGGGGDDIIRGFGGDDRLVGESGKDRMVGGQGNDILTGDGSDDRAYKDTFVFGENAGRDAIMDFDVGKDILEIARGLNGIKSPADVIDLARQKGGDVVIDLGGGNKLTLKNVDLDRLKKDPDDHFDIV